MFKTTATLTGTNYVNFDILKNAVFRKKNESEKHSLQRNHLHRANSNSKCCQFTVRQNNSPSQKPNQAESCGLSPSDSARTNHHHISQL